MKNTFLTLASGFTLGIIFFLFFGNNLPYPLSPFNRPTITVNGIGKVESANTEAKLTVTIRRQADNSQDASNKVAETNNTLFDKLKEFNIKDEDIKTEQITSYETYVREDKPEILIYPPQRDNAKKVWEAAQTTSLQIKDVSRIDELTTAIRSIENIELSGPEFQVDKDALEQELLEKAITDAKAKAEGIVEAGGQKLGKISSITDMNYSGVPYYESAPMMAKDSAGVVEETRLSPGSSELRREVQVVFFIR